MPSCSPARWKDTHCPRTSRSIPIAHLSARLITELMSFAILVGEVHPPGADPFDVFTARVRVEGEKAEGPDAARACRLAFPS